MFSFCSARPACPTQTHPPAGEMGEPAPGRERSRASKCCAGRNIATEMRPMIKSALLGTGLAVAIATAATAQPYSPYYYPGYSHYYSYPGYTYPTYGYPYGYSWYSGWPYPAPAYTYRPPPAYSDP